MSEVLASTAATDVAPSHVVASVVTDQDLRVSDGEVPNWLLSVVDVSGGVLFAPKPENATRFEAAVKTVLSQLPEAAPFKLRVRNEDWILGLVVSSAGEGGAGPSLQFRFMHPSERKLPNVSCLRAWFNLSKTEAAIALALAGGGDVAQIARDRSLSELTVRTHLRTIFEKTHSHSQRDLVSLILRVASL